MKEGHISKVVGKLRARYVTPGTEGEYTIGCGPDGVETVEGLCMQPVVEDKDEGNHYVSSMKDCARIASGIVKDIFTFIIYKPHDFERKNEPYVAHDAGGDVLIVGCGSEGVEAVEEWCRQPP